SQRSRARLANAAGCDILSLPGAPAWPLLFASVDTLFSCWSMAAIVTRRVVGGARPFPGVIPMLCFALAAALASAGADAAPATLPQVEVIGRQPVDTDTESLRDQDLRTPAAGDLAELLRAVNGVSAGRMGGHGLEPV